MNVLVVDDQIVVVRGLVKGLHWDDLSVENIYQAYSAEDARQVFKEHAIDIMLCDIEMPRENGLSLFRWVVHEYPQTECIFLTSHAEFKYAQEAIALGSFDYILQPAHYEDIEKRIRKARLKVLQKGRIHEFEEKSMEFLSELNVNKEVELEECIEKFRCLIEFSKQNAIRQGMISDLDEKNDTDELNPVEENHIRKAIQFIKDNLDMKITRKEVSEYIYLNEDYLSRLFKKKTGYMVKEFIMMEKLKLAKELLRSTNMSVSLISLKVGFSNFSHFSHAFRKQENISPNDYRNQHQNFHKNRKSE
jgi:YesN/AraC family two-component response regulator